MQTRLAEVHRSHDNLTRNGLCASVCVPVCVCVCVCVCVTCTCACMCVHTLVARRVVPVSCERRGPLGVIAMLIGRSPRTLWSLIGYFCPLIVEWGSDGRVAITIRSNDPPYVCSLYRSLSLIFSLSLSLSLCRSLSLSLSVALYPSLSLSLSVSLFVSLSLSLSIDFCPIRFYYHVLPVVYI